MAKRPVGRPRHITVQDAVTSFLRSKSLSASDHHIHTITSLMKPFTIIFGRRRVSSLTLDDMEQYAAYLLDTNTKYQKHWIRKPIKGKLSKSTVDAHHRTLRSFFNWMMKRPEYRIDRNPMLDVPRPRIFDNDVRIKHVEWETYKALLTAADQMMPLPFRLRALALLYFIPDTGCRAGGICGLRWSDVNLVTRQAQVTEKYGKKRTVFFLDITRQALEAWHMITQDSEFVFCAMRDWRVGLQLTPTGLYQIIRDLSEAAGISDDQRVSPHMLRHMFATEADAAGISAEYLQALMGHEKRETTQRYIHRSNRLLQEAHDHHSPLLKLINEERR